MCFYHLIHGEGNDLLNSEDKINAEHVYMIRLSSHLIYAQPSPGNSSENSEDQYPAPSAKEVWKVFGHKYCHFCPF